MTRPAYGRLPMNASRIVGRPVKEFIPISQFGVGANFWAPNSTTEAVSCVYVNDKLDVGSYIKLRVLWSSGSSTTTDTATFKILYTPVTIETDALPGLPSTALDTAITADACSATANILKYSPQGIINGGTVTDSDALVLLLNVNAVSGLTLDGTAAGGVVVYGVEIEYNPTYID